KNGDEVRVGSSIFVFAEDDGAESGDDQAWIEDFSTTMVLRQEDAVYREPSRDINLISTGERAIRDLSCLLKIGEVISSGGNLSELATNLLRTIARALPVESAAII